MQLMQWLRSVKKEGKALRSYYWKPIPFRGFLKTDWIFRLVVHCNNVSYETAFEFLSHSLEIFVDGVRQDENDFTITSAKSFDLNISPLSETENLRVNYIKAC